MDLLQLPFVVTLVLWVVLYHIVLSFNIVLSYHYYHSVTIYTLPLCTYTLLLYDYIFLLLVVYHIIPINNYTVDYDLLGQSYTIPCIYGLYLKLHYYLYSVAIVTFISILLLGDSGSSLGYS